MALVYEWIGRRSTDSAMTSDYTSERDKDITGKSFSIDTRGIDTQTFEIIINGNSEIARKIDEISERGLELSDLDGTFVVARRYKRIGTDYATGIPSAYRQDAKIVPSSFAPGNAELRGEVEIAFVGARVHGTFDPGAVDPEWEWLFPNGSFTPETSKPSRAQTHFKDGDASREEFGLFYEYDDAAI
jgi:hypothetical protein